MNQRQIGALIIGALLAAFVWFATPSPWRGEWVYYTPYSSLYIDRLQPAIAAIALVTAAALIALRPRRR